MSLRTLHLITSLSQAGNREISGMHSRAKIVERNFEFHSIATNSAARSRLMLN